MSPAQSGRELAVTFLFRLERDSAYRGSKGIFLSFNPLIISSHIELFRGFLKDAPYLQEVSEHSQDRDNDRGFSLDRFLLSACDSTAVLLPLCPIFGTLFRGSDTASGYLDTAIL